MPRTLLICPGEDFRQTRSADLPARPVADSFGPSISGMIHAEILA